MVFRCFTRMAQRNVFSYKQNMLTCTVLAGEATSVTGKHSNPEQMYYFYILRDSKHT